MHCAVIGLGEAGGRYAAALAAAGHEVSGFDPQAADTPPLVNRATTVTAAVTGADVVLVLTGAAAARPVAAQCKEAIGPGTCYADFTSSSPRTMLELAASIEETGAQFADVAILGSVPLYGAKTALMISGSGGQRLAALMASVHAPVEVLDEPAGSAMAHKLLRSVFMKGLASLVIEAVTAGKAAGYEEWITAQVAANLAGDGHAVIERLVSGTRLHAERRAHEMRDAVAYLRDLEVPFEMSAATEESHLRLATAEASA